MWDRWVWRERWHLAVVGLALVLLAGRWGGGPARPDPWRAAQQQTAQRLERAAAAWDQQTWSARLANQPSLAWRMIALTWGGIAVLGIGGMIWWRMLRRGSSAMPSPAGATPPVAAWGIWDLVKVCAWVVCGTAAAHVGIAVLVRAFGIKGVDRYVAATVGTLVVDLLAVAGVGLLVLRPRHLSSQAVGLGRGRIGPLIRTGLWAYAAWLPLLAVSVIVVMSLVRMWHLEPAPQAVVAILLEESRPRLVWLLMGLIAVIGPVAEEILFRGVAYPALRGRVGARWAMAGSAALFAALHADLFAFGPIFVLGIWLAWVYERTGSLIPSITVHMVHNGVMLATVLTIRDLLAVAGAGSR